MWTKRQGIVIWVKNLKFVQKIRKFGHVIYVSKKQKYILLYVDQEDVEHTMKVLNDFPFVTKVEPSYKPFIKTEYEKVSFDKTKEYDFKYDMQ